MNQEQCLQQIPNQLAPLCDSFQNCDLINFVAEDIQSVVLYYASPIRLIYMANPLIFYSFYTLTINS